MINLKSMGITAAEALMVLYNNSKPQGRGFLQFKEGDMTLEQAQALLNQTQYFDYLRGRVMKLDFSKNEIETYLYNRDLGPDAAENAILDYRTRPLPIAELVD